MRKYLLLAIIALISGCIGPNTYIYHVTKDGLFDGWFRCANGLLLDENGSNVRNKNDKIIVCIKTLRMTRLEAAEYISKTKGDK